MTKFIPGHQRPLSTYIAGNPGNGKSSLIQRMALYDITHDRGVCIIDPTGDLVNRLIHHIPKSRINDTVYFDTTRPIPIDLFSYDQQDTESDERQDLTDDLVGMLALENAPRARPLLRQVISTLFDANENSAFKDKANFFDILKFIRNKKRRDAILAACPAERREDWEPFPKVTEFESILYRMIPFSESRALKTMFSSTGRQLNLSEVIENKQVLLVNLKDTDTDALVGSIIVSKLQQAIFRRRNDKKGESKRVPYYLYIDECQTIIKFAVESFDKILMRARKYKLCLTMANQLPSKLPLEIRESLGMIGNTILFNLDPTDGRMFKDRIVPYKVEDLFALPAFRAIRRVNRVVNKIATPAYLGYSAASCAHLITKRPVDEPPCETKEDMVLLEGNGNAPDSQPTRPEVEPEGSPNVPPHERKGKNPRKPR
jgi:hypothetical protein